MQSYVFSGKWEVGSGKEEEEEDADFLLLEAALPKVISPKVRLWLWLWK
jgi:hypothetical protein